MTFEWTWIAISRSILVILSVRNSSTTCCLLNRVDVRGRVAVPIYNARSRRLSVERDCLTRSSNTRTWHVSSYISLRVLYTITLADGGSNWEWSARCRYEIRYASKFNAASRGPPCDSTAFFFIQARTFPNKHYHRSTILVKIYPHLDKL